MTASQHLMPFGTQILPDGSVLFNLFAPAQPSVNLKLAHLDHPLPMAAQPDGWHTLTTADARPGTRYTYLLPDTTEAPDPASRFQPEDVHGPSEVIDPSAFIWTDDAWRGRPWNEAILYELHIGTFTPEGNFPAATLRLDHLAALGITAIELMCIDEFPGNRNWGYDGVLPFAPDSAYGRPEEAKAFINRAHDLGLMVLLDVVYNHFGPEGNYLPKFLPNLSSDRHHTPWGQALNFDGPGSQPVRDLILHNAVYWVQEFHFDGLRLDASHAMIDESPHHILDELRECIQQTADQRYVHLILENEINIAGRLARDAEGRPSGYTAQWNHDITHLLSAVMGKPCDQRQQDDAGETERLGKALAFGFVIALDEQGGLTEALRVPPTAYIAFIQTHDLIGNRIFGDRIDQTVSPEAVKAIASICLLLPQVPMLFMGEEWAASTPFPYFCDYHGDLAEAVRKGRCDQLSKQDPAPSPDELRRAPDPQAESTLRSAQLQWSETTQGEHAERLAWYTRLLHLRTRRIVPLLAGLTETCGHYEVHGPGALAVHWTLAHGARLHLTTNLCASTHTPVPPQPGELLYQQGTPNAPWSVTWTLENQNG